MLAHLQLLLQVCHTNDNLSFLRLRNLLYLHHCLLDRSLVSNYDIFNGLFEISDPGINPLESHSLKRIFCRIVNVSLLTFISDSKFQCRLVELPYGFLIYFFKIAQSLDSLLSSGNHFVIFNNFENFALRYELLDNLIVSCFYVLTQSCELLKVF